MRWASAADAHPPILPHAVVVACTPLGLPLLNDRPRVHRALTEHALQLVLGHVLHRADRQRAISLQNALCQRLLRVCHTPGALLDRPDQTSRGDPVEEPRQRLLPRHSKERFLSFVRWMARDAERQRQACTTGRQG